MYVDTTHHSGPGYFNESFDRYLGQLSLSSGYVLVHAGESNTNFIFYINQTILYPEQG